MANTPPYNAVTTNGGAAIADEERTFLLNRVSWGAIFAGAVAALVVQSLLSILGLGVGAVFLNIGDSASNPAVGSFSESAGIWWAVSGIIASFVGGLVAGRLCGAGTSNTARWHGFVSWCTTTLVLLYLLSTVFGGIIGGAASVIENAVGSASNVAVSTVAGMVNGGNSDALARRVRQLVNPNDTQNVQDSVVTYIRAVVSGNKQGAAAAKDQAVNGLAKAANISADEANARINQAVQQYQDATGVAAQKAVQAAKISRRAVAYGGIVGFVALVIGAIAAWIGGGIGKPRQAVALDRTI